MLIDWKGENAHNFRESKRTNRELPLLPHRASWDPSTSPQRGVCDAWGVPHKTSMVTMDRRYCVVITREA